MPTRDLQAANRAPPAARPHVHARLIHGGSAMPGFARRAILAPDPRKTPSWRPRSAGPALRLDKPSELLELQPGPARRHPREDPSAMHVEKPKRQHALLKTDPRRGHP